MRKEEGVPWYTGVLLGGGKVHGVVAQEPRRGWQTTRGKPRERENVKGALLIVVLD